MNDDRGALIRIAAELITQMQQPENADEYKFRMPKYILRQNEKNNNRLKDLAHEIGQIARRIKN